MIPFFLKHWCQNDEIQLLRDVADENNYISECDG